MRQISLFQAEPWYIKYISESISKYRKIICWFSGGITSAIACKLMIDTFGKDYCEVIFIGTNNEDDDSYRFLKDCEKWYGLDIKTISSSEYKTIQDVWYKYLSLNVATGAICSTKLKREVREIWQRTNAYSFQVFGFDIKEFKRARSMKLNNPEVRAVFPLLYKRYSKAKCFEILEAAGIRPPSAYLLGYHNNNCLKTMCVQGGIGYWQKVQREAPDKFDAMAKVEHDLTDLKGKPVTMLKDQSNHAKSTGNTLVFLKPHPKYPNVKDLSMMKPQEVKPLIECNGFCGINDFSEKNPTEKEINFDLEALETDKEALQRTMKIINKRPVAC